MSEILSDDLWILNVSASTYIDLVLSRKYGPAGENAHNLLMFYQLQARRQKTNQPRATDEFCMRGLGWSKDKFHQAKKILIATQNLEQVRPMQPGQRHYIRVKFILKTETVNELAGFEKDLPVSPENQGSRERVPRKSGESGEIQETCGSVGKSRVPCFSVSPENQGTEMLKEINNKKLKEINNTMSDSVESDSEELTPLHSNFEQRESDPATVIFLHWQDQKIIIHRQLTPAMRKEAKAALKLYDLPDIKNAISNYAKVLKGDQYYFSHTWRLEEFIKRGLAAFLDESRPLERFLSARKPAKNGGQSFVDFVAAKEGGAVCR